MATVISGDTGIDKVQDGTIVNADIASGAAIANSKLSGNGKIVQYTTIYNSDTQVSYSNQSSVQLTGKDHYYWPSAVMSGTFTKQFDAATSIIVVGGHYFGYFESNSHSFWMWESSHQSTAINLGHDIYALSGEDGPSPRKEACVSVDCIFTDLGVGSQTINAGAGTGDGRSMTGSLNTNTGALYGDTSNNTTRSQMWITEVLL